MTSVTLREYAEPDEAQIFALWQRALGRDWPLTQAAFRSKIVDNAAYRHGDHLVATAGGDIVGFVSTQACLVPGEERPRGALPLIMVDPAFRKQGIGRALLNRAMVSLRERLVSRVQLGSGALCYFWPGVPIDLSDAWPFFQACGWTEAERTFDLAGDLYAYSTPPWVYDRVRQAGVSLVSATQEDLAAMLAFEVRQFPAWLIFYEALVAQGNYADIVLAKDLRGEIVGTAYAMDFRRPAYRADFVWQAILGENIGGVGPLGVAEPMRDRGIGLALAARATELLQARGLAISFIGYTWLVDWYGKLGYRLWREYRTGFSKQLQI